MTSFLPLFSSYFILFSFILFFYFIWFFGGLALWDRRAREEMSRFYPRNSTGNATTPKGREKNRIV
jgi:hypothetical protein